MSSNELRAVEKRKRNFREDEILCLVEGIADEKVVIMSKLQSLVTNKKKEKEVWREITAKVTAFGVGKIVRPTLRLWGESSDRHLLKHRFGSSVAKWLRN